MDSLTIARLVLAFGQRHQQEQRPKIDPNPKRLVQVRAVVVRMATTSCFEREPGGGGQGRIDYSYLEQVTVRMNRGRMWELVL
jgi:hypothetical protein